MKAGVLEYFKETEQIGEKDTDLQIQTDNRYMKRYLLQELAHIVIGRQEVPQSTICKLENKESLWYNSV